MNLDETISKLEAVRAHWASQGGDTSALLVVFGDGAHAASVDNIEFGFLDSHDDTQCIRLSEMPATGVQRAFPRLVHTSNATA